MEKEFNIWSDNRRDCSQEGRSEIVDLLLRNKANPNLSRADGSTALYIAAQNGHKRVVEQLLDAGATPNAACQDGATPLFIASQESHADVVKVLASRGANVDAPFCDGTTALIVAAQNGSESVVEVLIKNYGMWLNCGLEHDLMQWLPPANPNAKCEDGTTALFVACQNGKTEIVRRLLALPSIRINSASTEDGSTPLYIASQNGHLSVVEALLEVPDIGTFE